MTQNADSAHDRDYCVCAKCGWTWTVRPDNPWRYERVLVPYQALPGEESVGDAIRRRRGQHT